MRNGFTQTHIIICTLLKKLYFSLLAIKLQVESAVTLILVCTCTWWLSSSAFSSYRDKLNRSIQIMGEGEGGKRSESLLVQQEKHASSSVTLTGFNFPWFPAPHPPCPLLNDTPGSECCTWWGAGKGGGGGAAPSLLSKVLVYHILPPATAILD